MPVFGERFSLIHGDSPVLPDLMSVSALREIEACPRQWWLRRASYPGIWKRKGYPDFVYWGALRGRVVHKTIESIVRRATQSAHSGAAAVVEALRELGGITKLAKSVADGLFQELLDNPRTTERVDAWSRRLVSELPKIREDIQGEIRVIGPRIRPRGHSQTQSREPVRTPLSLGVYPEVDLRDSDRSWVGVADLLIVEKNCVEIIDIKTGREDLDGHFFQLQVYAFLWDRDTERNPSRLPVNTISIAYPHRTVSRPALSGSALQQFAGELRERTSRAIGSLKGGFPIARPQVDVCVYCGVRHLCSEYWAALKDWTLCQPSITSISHRLDLEVKVMNRRGRSSLESVVTRGSGVRPGTSVVLNFQSDQELSRLHTELRILGAFRMHELDEEGDEQDIEIGISAVTEVFEVPRGASQT